MRSRHRSPSPRRLAALLVAAGTLAGVAAAPAVTAQAAAASRAAPAAAARPAAPGSAPLTSGQALGLARKAGKPVLVTSATTPTTTLTANPDGTLTATESSVPVRKEAGGRWLPLDAALHRNGDGSVAPAVTTLGVTLSGGGTGPLARVADGPDALSMTFPGPLPAPSLSGATATYRDVLPGVDLAVTVTQQGSLDAVLVVRSATAAASPALRHLALGQAVTGGLTLRAAPSGEVAAVNRAGRVVFEEPVPRMWDSTVASRPVPTAIRPSTGQRVDLYTGQPVTSGIAAPGEAARTARVAVGYGHGTVTYAPALSLLAGKATAYPVYIDPGVSGGGTLQYWAQVDTINTGATHPKPTPDTQVGYEGWPSTGAYDFTARSFFTMGVPNLLWGTPKADVYSASFKITEDIAPACMTSPPQGDFGVQIWRTGYVGPAALPTWSSQPSWIAEEEEKAFSYGANGGCPGTGSVGFNVLEAAQWAATATTQPATVSFGLKADNEGDKWGWKEFLPDATLSVTFDRPPSVNSLQTSPSTRCAADDAVGKGDVMLSATLHSPFGSNVALTKDFYASETVSGAAVPGLNPTGTPPTYTDGSVVHALIPEATFITTLGLTKLTEFTWYVTVSDGTLSATSAICHFQYDPTTPGPPHVVPDPNYSTSYQIGSPAVFDVTPPDNFAGTVAGYNYQLNGDAPTYRTATNGDLVITVYPTARTEVLNVTAMSSTGNAGAESFPYPFSAAAPATAEADGDLTGDGIPDLALPGGASGLSPGLWLARGQAGAGQATGDGQVSSSLANVGLEGNGIGGTYSPADFTGGHVITGLFSNDNLQATLTYYPAGNYAGSATVLYNSGDGTDYNTSGADSAETNQDTNFNFWDLNDKKDGNVTNPTEDIPLQVANAYHSYLTGSAADVTLVQPDLITISGHDNTTTTTNVMPGSSSQLGYYLEYYPSGSEPAAWSYSMILDTTTTPDGTMDWNNWQIYTMAEPHSSTYPDGAVDMFLYKPSTGELDLWQNFTVTPDALGQWATASYSPYQLKASGSGWQPVDTSTGATLAGLQAADINGAGPALWAISSTAQVTPWFVSGLTAPTGGATTGTGTISPGSAQSLLAPTHLYRLGDATSGAVTSAADTGSAPTTSLSGTGNVNWVNTPDLFNPAASFGGGSTAYLTETTSGLFNNVADYTISAWVKPTVLGGAVFSTAGASTSCDMLYIDTTTVNGITYGRWNYRVSNADTSSPTWSTATAGDTYYVKLGAWTHLTVTYNAASNFIRLYVNGIPAASVSPSTVWSGHCSTVSLGRYIDYGGATHGIFQGEIADAQAWAGQAMTPTEVAAISGNHGYAIFPSDGATYHSAANSTTWQWTTMCGQMNYYQGTLTIKQPGSPTCTGTGTYYFGVTSPSKYPDPGATFALQGSDGNFVMRNNAGAAIWTPGFAHAPGDVMLFQPDGNLVIYGSDGKTLWATNTANAPAGS